ncbi:hypothetical protein LPJ59_000039 [Coemansia sp. RSA 2399]|nr:hypothetical protein LPJ59_000039 [Coemansia sp. RSA 2399]KAJ1908537.1 hypothetical protein LPJ81_000038 [Coemansia sp. IMI 209127]
MKLTPTDPAHDYLSHPSDLLTQTVFAATLGGSAFVAFCLLRFRWPDVYAPRGRLLYAAPARVGKTVLGWISMTVQAKDYDLLYSVGLDAVLVLRLFKMLGALSVTASIIGAAVVVPLKVFLDDSEPANGVEAGGASLRDRITKAAMGSERPLVVHFALAYVFTGLVYFYFARFAYQALSLRWHYLLRVRNTRPARSVMVTGVPDELASEDALKQHFEQCNGLGKVEAVEIVPRIARLGVLVRRREKLLLQIEEQVTVVLGNPCMAPGYDRDQLGRLLLSHSDDTAARLEAIQLLKLWSLPRFKTGRRGARKLQQILALLEESLQGFHHADAVVAQVRHEWFASFDSTRDRRSTVGFVTFEDAESAHLAAQSFSYAQPFQLRTELAPEPRDVFWDNVTLPLASRIARGCVSLGAYALMLAYWLTISILLSMLVSPDFLKTYIPRLGDLIDRNKWLKGLFQYTAPTFVLSLMNALAPYILNWLAQLSGIQSRSGIQRSVLSRYFFFLVANVLLIFTVFRTLLTDYRRWVEDPGQIPILFTKNLPGAAPFFINYIVLYGFGYYPIQLLQLGSISVAVLRRIVCRTPRQFATALRPNDIDWAFILPQPMLVFVIMATYSSLAPLVCVFAAIYYAIAYVVTKYLVYYVYARQFETAGEFIVPILKLLVGSLWHYYCLIIGLCALNRAFGYVVLLFPLLWANTYVLSHVSRQFYANARFLPLDLLSQYAPTPHSNSSNNASSQQPTTTIQPDAVHASHSTSTDYLLPRPHVPSPFGALLDAIDTENRGALSVLLESAAQRIHRVWALVFSKIYIDPQRTPQLFRHLDRCYSLNGGIEHGLLIPDETTADSHHRLSLDGGGSQQSDSRVATPRFSTTFGDFQAVRAELMLGRDQRENKIQADSFTDFEQSPARLLQGVLDQGLAVYDHPYLVGTLPTLWLPMKGEEVVDL